MTRSIVFDSLSYCPVVQMPTANVRNANTGRHTDFVDSTVDNVLLETNSDFVHLRLEFIDISKRRPLLIFVSPEE